MNRILQALSASCDQTAQLLSDYHDGELGGLRRWRVEKHLAVCDGCRAVYRSFTYTVESIRAVGRIEPEPQPLLAEAVRRRIEG